VGGRGGVFFFFFFFFFFFLHMRGMESEVVKEEQSVSSSCFVIKLVLIVNSLIPNSNANKICLSLSGYKL
jgi:hypothetical protein